MTCRVQCQPEMPRYHDLKFTRDEPGPDGYAKCKACGYWVNGGWWATELCPGPPRKEEDSP